MQLPFVPGDRPIAAYGCRGGRVIGRPGSIASLLSLILLAGCSAAGDDRETVERLVFDGAPELARLTAEGETRLAARVTSPHSTRVCLPSRAPSGPRSLEIGARSAGPGVTLRLRAPDGEGAEAPIDGSWSDLRLTLAPGSSDCVQVEIGGAPDTEVALSTPLLLRSGRRRPWVLLYVVDTLRFDHTTAGGASERAAPAFEQLASEGILYARAFSASSWTRPSVASLLTGLGPSLHGVFDRQDRLPASLPRLPDWLAEAGWFTAAVSTNPNVLPVWGFLRGFDRFVDVDSRRWGKDSGLAGLGERARALVEQHSKRPVFLYVHDNEPHFPYRPLPDYREMFGGAPAGSQAETPQHPGDPDEMRGARLLYSAEIRSTSDRFGALLASLRGVDRYRDALIILVGDHGEEFGEHGDLGHGRTLYQEQLHVPLLIKPPAGTAPTGRVELAVALEDLAPTVSSLLGLTPPPALAGRRLPFPGETPAPAPPLLSELDLDGHQAEAAILWPWKYLRTSGDREQLFDLGADPGERRDLAASRPDLVSRLRSAADARRAAGHSGLVLSCVAGARVSRLRLELRFGGEAEPRTQGIGLEVTDRVTAEPGAARVAFQLRPAETIPNADFNDLLSARAQPDRDGVRIADPPGETVRIRDTGGPLATSVRLVGPGGEPLPTGGRAIPLARIAVATAPRELAAREEATCRISHLLTRSDVVPDESIDSSLRERLRDLGYLQ